MNRHSIFCLRDSVLREVHKHINLSTTERQWLYGMVAAISPCCNCKLSREGDARVRSKDELAREVMGMVMTQRRVASGHPARGVLGSMVMARVGERVEGEGIGDAGEGAQVIRIDFGNRRRII